MNQLDIPGIKQNEVVASYTTFGLGGKAKWLYVAKTPDELISILSSAKKNKLKHCVIAGGSNIVFSNKPFAGLVVVYRKKFNPTSDLMVKKNLVRMPASIILDDLVAYTVRQGWCGLEKLSLIPGTVGGAIVGNAGAYGAAIGDLVSRVEIFDGQKRRFLTAAECQFGYRDSIFKRKDWHVLSVELKIKKTDCVNQEELAELRKKIISDRKAKFYDRIKCPGSFFKNVLAKKVSKAALNLIDKEKIIDGKIPAGYLLSQVGARGMKVGGIFVADFHANILLNSGTGTYRDVISLSKKLKDKVYKRFGIILEEEVRLID